MTLIEEHFNLHQPPFPQVTDATSLLHHQSLKEALARLLFAVERCGIALVSAESGCGKSTLLGCLSRELDPTTHLVIYSSHSSLGPFSLLSSLSTKIGLRSRRFKGETVMEIVNHLRELSKRTVIIFDEAHLIPDNSLEDLRLLTADSLDRQSPFTLILAGQPVLRERLSEPRHYALEQRITARVRLRPLTDSEVALFIDKHLRACGANRVLFEPDAVTLIFQHSRGIPRRIQNLTLATLLAAASANKKTADADCVQQALLEQEAP